MKKLITLLYLSITSFSFANEFYIETTKETIGSSNRDDFIICSRNNLRTYNEIRR
jgi:hypothetical protein